VLAVAILSGFFAAHAVWSISDGEMLIPIYAYLDESDQRHLERLDAVPADVAVKQARDQLDRNPHKAKCAVLIYDGYMTIAGVKTDALMLEIRDYSDSPKSVRIAIPYSPKSEKSAFVVYRPKLVEFPGPADETARKFLEAFWQGVEDHKQGSAVWNAHIDQSR
jgi:hypothetical protein